MARGKKYGKYYAEFKRILHNLRNKAYRARQSGLEYEREIPHLTRTPTRRELERLVRQNQNFDSDVRYVSSSGTAVVGRRAAREAQREERRPIRRVYKDRGEIHTIDKETGEIISIEKIDENTKFYDTDEYEPDEYNTIDEIDDTEYKSYIAEDEEDRSFDEAEEDDERYNTTIEAGKILHDRLVDIIENLEDVLQPYQRSTMARTPGYDKAIHDIQRMLLNGLANPSEEMYLAIQKNFRFLLDTAKIALSYTDDVGAHVDDFLDLLNIDYTIYDTVNFSDIGDSYEEP